MIESKVYATTEYYVKCEKCKSRTEVDTYDYGTIECMHSGELIEYDNGNPENAIQE